MDQVIDFDWSKEYLAEDMLLKQRRPRQPAAQAEEEEEKKGEPAAQQAPPLKTFYAIIKLERDTLSQEQTLLIGSKLDAETA